MLRTPDTTLASRFTSKSHAHVPPSLNPSTNRLSTPLNVLILGASRGIGAGIARSYARAGAGVLILAARESSSDELASVAQSIRTEKGCEHVEVHCTQVDLTSSTSMATLAAYVQTLCALDIAVLNAGYSGPVVLDMTTGAPQDFADVMAVNVQGTYLAAHHLVPVLQDASGARTFVVVNSLASCIVRGHIANTAYCVSKLAQARLVEFVAEQFGEHGVTAHAVHPGAVNTEMADSTTPESFRPYLTDHVELCGAFCVWLTRERRAWLSGRLVCATWDVDELVEKREKVERGDLLKFGYRAGDAADVGI